MSKQTEMQRFIRHFRDESGEQAIDMTKVAKAAKLAGWTMPKPRDPIDILARQFAKAARQETKTDQDTGRPYRVNHALPSKKGSQGTLWIDIDKATRSQMLTSLTLRREQMVGDGVQLTYDADHWNAANPDEDQIQMEMDFTFDIELRKHSSDIEDETA